MKVSKHLESILFAAAILGTVGAYAGMHLSEVERSAAPQAASAAIDGPMQVIVIKGKRLSAAEKASLA